ncbi:CLUMA_CG007748, isoform A [Clunio marinus]|uniref:CLUMA_CG007748, isoform A n=1 Tax=Clunio marinus TaxID=568069 RepID=A0A1J1I737_9DIPT|nr:CLUMA_CG007748, isoform A [Clunio marinus]
MIKLFEIVFISYYVLFVSTLELTGDHVCYREENYTEIVNLTTSVPVQVRKNFWCLEKIRCSELQPDIQEIVRNENITKTRTVEFCCPDYQETESHGVRLCNPFCAKGCVNGYCDTPGKCECHDGFMGELCDKKCPSGQYGKNCDFHCKCGKLECHPQTGECLREEESIEVNKTIIDSDSFNASIINSTEHNPYEHYKGEYGKQFNHYLKMSVNESNVQQSIDKIIDMEVRLATEGRHQQGSLDKDEYIVYEVDGNESDAFQLPKHSIEQEAMNYHEEMMTMVTVNCFILAVIVLLIFIYVIRKIVRKRSRNVDPEFNIQEFQKPLKLIQEPLPMPPIRMTEEKVRPKLRKSKSVTFDESVDIVDEMNRGRASSLPDTYDIPRQPISIIDIYTQSKKMKTKNSPEEIRKPEFNTFPKKNTSRRQSMEHIYDELTISPEIINVENDLTDALYGNEETSTQQLQNIEKYGLNTTNRYNTIYPQLSNATDAHSNHLNGSVGGEHYKIRADNSTFAFQPYDATERFLNTTRSSMSSGVCMKEVPTASLQRQGEVFVAGNGSDPTLSRIQVCCEGYQRNIHNFRKCDPICKKECVNGFCAAPETCVCYPDHVVNLGGFCIPTCPIGCGNGFCNGNVCTCKDGFTLEPSKKFCVPICSNGCRNGNCTAPEQCTCNQGFLISESGTCDAVCSKGCLNGDCISPEVCQCHKGYEKVNDICQPRCSRGCLNGICAAPEVCQCPGNGWSLDSTGTKCVASCDKACLNGVCSGPNQCTCRNGYTLDIFDSFRCIPKCDPPCINAVCSGSNLCLCNPGFVKDRSVKGNNRCVRI